MAAGRRGLRLRRRPVLRVARRCAPAATRSWPWPARHAAAGYWFTDDNGAVSAFGDATYWGSAPQVLNKPIVGMAEAVGTGHFSAVAVSVRRYGYDVSNLPVQRRCRRRPTPSAWSRSTASAPSAAVTLPGAEAAWAGGGLNLYVPRPTAPAATAADAACDGRSPACNFGFAAAQTPSPRPRTPASTPRSVVARRRDRP